jgi:hypothetical protein
MPRTQRTQRTRSRVKRSRTMKQNAADHQAALLEMIRNRRYVAFVRAIVGAARLRNSSR